MAHLLVEVFGQAFDLAPGLVEQAGQVLAVFFRKIPQDAEAQPPASPAGRGTENLQVGQQTVGRARLDGGRSFGLLVTLQKNQGRFEQALARHPVAGLISGVEDPQVAAAESRVAPIASTSSRQTCRLARAKGTRYFAAPCAPISPRRTRS